MGLLYLYFLGPSGPVQACNGTALPLPLPTVYIFLVFVRVCGPLSAGIIATPAGRISVKFSVEDHSDSIFLNPNLVKIGQEYRAFDREYLNRFYCFRR